MKKRLCHTLRLPLYLAFLLVLTACKAHLKEGNKQLSVSGTVFTNRVYCGGAKPTDKMLKQLKEPMAYAKKAFYLKQLSDDYSKQKTLLKFVSDSLGEFKIEVKSGSYAVFLTEQINQIDISNLKHLQLDGDCYSHWLNTPFDTIKVNNKVNTAIRFFIQKKCFVSVDIPCLTYVGPRPQ